MMNRGVRGVWAGLAVLVMAGTTWAETARPLPESVYVPYERLKAVMDKQPRGVFLPYEDFEALWRAAQGSPAAASAVDVPYLISVARYTGRVGAEFATMELALTVDVVAGGWVQVPIGLGGTAVSGVAFTEPTESKHVPLLRVVKGQYVLVARGPGRYVLKVDFVRQLQAKPPLKVLDYRMPAAAISTLDLVIPQENVKVTVEPMLAAGTQPETVDGKPATRLRAFFGSADGVTLSWQPRTRAAAELAAVMIADQLQHIHVSEAVVSYTVTLKYDVRRRGIDSLSVRLPAGFRVTAVRGENISTWDIAAGTGQQTLGVKLFSPVKGTYELAVTMERFLKDKEVQVPISAVATDGVLRRTGLLAITHSPRRSVQLQGAKQLARVDVGRLPERLRKMGGAMAYRFITAEYAGTLAIGTVRPRISAEHHWTVGVDSDRMVLRGRLNYVVKRSGVFKLGLTLPQPWRVESVGPGKIVDEFRLVGSGPSRRLEVLFRKELSGKIGLKIAARADRGAADEAVRFVLPLPDAEHLQTHAGTVVLILADRLRASVDGLDQFQPRALKLVKGTPAVAGLSPAMAFAFRAVDRDKPAAARFKVSVKPTQVSAVAHRLVNIRPGSIEDEAAIDYNVRYAPVDTFYVKVSAALAEAGVRITGKDIKEKPQVDAVPGEQVGTTQPASQWAYYKVVLQSPRVGRYRLTVRVRRPFQADQVGRVVTVPVWPILAAGKLSRQSGHVAVAKAETLAIGEPTSEKLVAADAGSATDLPHAAHRKVASLAFKYTAVPFSLTLPVARQAEAAVFTTIAHGVLVEQAMALDGTLNTHAIYLLSTSRGDRLPMTLPTGAKVFAVKVNGSEVAVETGASAEERIVRLPPTAGQVSKVVVELSYGLDDADVSRLTAPALPAGIPVQQTVWRVWVPNEYAVLRYDRVFAQLGQNQAAGLVSRLARGQPGEVAFTLSPSGQAWHFVRQGGPGVLSMTTAREETVTIGVWVVVLAAGVAMLKLGGYLRCVIVLALAVVGGVLNLFMPLAVEWLALTGVWGAVIVLGVWAAQWVFVKLPKTTWSGREG